MLEIWSEFLGSPMAIPIIAIVVGVAVPVITASWCEREKHKEEYKLKGAMIERGMSAEEIERVLAAKSTEKRNLTDPRASCCDRPSRAVA